MFLFEKADFTNFSFDHKMNILLSVNVHRLLQCFISSCIILIIIIIPFINNSIVHFTVFTVMQHKVITEGNEIS